MTPDRSQRDPEPLGSPTGTLGDRLIGNLACLFQLSRPVECESQLDGDLGGAREVTDRAREGQRLAQGSHPRGGISDRGGVAADAAQRADLGLGRTHLPRRCERFLGEAIGLVEMGTASPVPAPGCPARGLAPPKEDRSGEAPGHDGRPAPRRPGWRLRGDRPRDARAMRRCASASGSRAESSSSAPSSQRDRPIVGAGHGSRLGRPHPQLLARHAVHGLHLRRPQAQRQVEVGERVPEGEHPLRRAPGAQQGRQRLAHVARLVPVVSQL